MAIIAAVIVVTGVPVQWDEKRFCYSKFLKGIQDWLGCSGLAGPE